MGAAYDQLLAGLHPDIAAALQEVVAGLGVDAKAENDSWLASLDERVSSLEQRLGAVLAAVDKAAEPQF